MGSKNLLLMSLVGVVASIGLVLVLSSSGNGVQARRSYEVEGYFDPEEDQIPTRWRQRARRCCDKYRHEMILNPDRFSRRSGCDLDSCRKEWIRRQNNHFGGLQTERRRSVSRSIFQTLLACVTELVLNLSQFRLELPASCCQLPLVGYLPFCGIAPQPSPPPPPTPSPNPPPAPFPNPSGSPIVPGPGPGPGPGPNPFPGPRPSPFPQPGPIQPGRADYSDDYD